MRHVGKQKDRKRIAAAAVESGGCGLCIDKCASSKLHPPMASNSSSAPLPANPSSGSGA